MSSQIDAPKTAADMTAYVKANLGTMIADRMAEAIEKSRENQASNVPTALQLRQQVAHTKNQAAVARVALGTFAKALARANNQKDTAAEIAKRYGDEYVGKALAESTFVDGGAMVPVDMSREVIEVLRPQTVVMALGARELPMPNGNLTLPYAATGATAYTPVENANVANSQPTFGQLQLWAKKFMVAVATSNDLLNDASPMASQFIQDDIVAALKVLEDQQFLRGTGTGGGVLGLKYLAATTQNARNAAGTAGGSTTSEIIKDLMDCMQNVYTANVPVTRGGWAMSYRTEFALKSLRDGVGNFYFKDEMDGGGVVGSGTLWGFPYKSTSSLPINLSTVGGLSSKESELCFADWYSVLVGRTENLSIQAVPYGTYYDQATAGLISGISTDQTIILAKERADINVRYRGAEVTWLQGVTWGA